MNRGSSIVAGALAVTVALAGCETASVPPQVQAWIAAGGTPPPPQRACPGVAAIDLDRMARAQAARPRDPTTTGFIDLPASAEALIPAEAVVVIRTHLPPGGLYANDLRTAVWKMPDGAWHGWRQNRAYGTPTPPPPPPPLPEWSPDSPEYRAAIAAEALYQRTLGEPDLRWPPTSGRLPAETAEAIEVALADPCRAWDPATYPHSQPLRRRENGADTRLCPPDGGVYLADLTEPGRPRRALAAGCINDTPTFRLMRAAAYAEPEG